MGVVIFLLWDILIWCLHINCKSFSLIVFYRCHNQIQIVSARSAKLSAKGRLNAMSLRCATNLPAQNYRQCFYILNPNLWKFRKWATTFSINFSSFLFKFCHRATPAFAFMMVIVFNSFLYQNLIFFYFLWPSATLLLYKNKSRIRILQYKILKKESWINSLEYAHQSLSLLLKLIKNQIKIYEPW